MRLLVTGAAGFIGSNFVRHWVTRHPTDYLVALDALTYAGNLDNLSDLGDRVCFVHQDVCDLAGVEATLAAHGIDTVVHFAGGVPQQPGGARPGPVLSHQRPRHAGAPRGVPAGRGWPLPPHLDL